MQIEHDQIKAGLVDNVQDSQDVFRRLLNAMSEPGTLETLGQELDTPKSLNSASYAIALSLFDEETRFALGRGVHHRETVSSLLFYCSSTLVKNPGRADFVICDETEIPQLDTLRIGTEAYPHLSGTLIVQCKSLRLGCSVVATGPGIEDSRRILCSGLTGDLLEQRRQMQTLFPLGIDMIFTCENEFIALPRTTILKAEIT